MEINVAAIAGSLAAGGAVVYFINAAYNYFKIGSLAQKNVKKLGNVLALQVKKYALDGIKDAQLRNKVKMDLNRSGDAFDEGWDLGLEGKEV